MPNPPHTGTCVGGPLDNQQITVRTEQGFLAVDKRTSHAWVYKRHPDGRFHVCTDHDNTTIYPHGAIDGRRTLQPDRALQAAALGTLDIITIDRAAQ